MPFANPTADAVRSKSFTHFSKLEMLVSAVSCSLGSYTSAGICVLLVGLQKAVAAQPHLLSASPLAYSDLISFFAFDLSLLDLKQKWFH